MSGSGGSRYVSRSVARIAPAFWSRSRRRARARTAAIWVRVSFAAVCGVGALISSSSASALVSSRDAYAVSAPGKYSRSVLRNHARSHTWTRDYALRGGYCATIGKALRSHYGFDDEACAFFDFFARPATELEQQAADALGANGLDAPALADAREYGLLLQSYEHRFWDTLGVLDL